MEKTDAACHISLPLRWQVDPGPLSFPVPGLSLALSIQACQTHPRAPLCCRHSPVQDQGWVTLCLVVAKKPAVEAELGKSFKTKHLGLSLG